MDDGSFERQGNRMNYAEKGTDDDPLEQENVCVSINTNPSENEGRIRLKSEKEILKEKVVPKGEPTLCYSRFANEKIFGGWKNTFTN